MNVKIGLIVNPIAGMGGRVGLKGTDGEPALAEAISRGAVPLAATRAREAFTELLPLKERFELYSGAGPLGEGVLRELGLSPAVLGVTKGTTSAADTVSVAEGMARLRVDLILFAGGDGTARDVAGAIGESTLGLGIPAGVKIHSAVFASSPKTAGLLVARFISEERVRAAVKLAEVMDIDEEAYREGRLSARLFGYMRIPYEKALVQGVKAGSTPSEASAQAALAVAAAEQVRRTPETLFLIGAGSTTHALSRELGAEGTLLGIDAWMGGRLLAADLREADILSLIEKHPVTAIVITPIGGQGFLFGRGNQQFSPEVLERVGKDRIFILASESKINSLVGAPLLIDTGDRELDGELAGYYRVLCAPGRYLIYRAEVA